MSITSTCPGCGAPIQISEQSGAVTCTFCGTHFNVNLDAVNPAFSKAENQGETVEAAPQSGFGQGNMPASSDELYNPPIPGAGTDTPAEQPQAPAFSQPDIITPEAPQPMGFFRGKRLWISVAVAALVVFCTSCLCLLVVYRAANL